MTATHTVLTGWEGTGKSTRLREIADANPGKTVVVGCHGLAIRMGTANVLGWDYPTTTRLASMFNCGWTTLTARPQGDWKLVTWNQVALQRPS